MAEVGRAGRMRFGLLRSYYEINRVVWPTMPRRAAFIDAFKLWRKTRAI